VSVSRSDLVINDSLCVLNIDSFPFIDSLPAFRFTPKDSLRAPVLSLFSLATIESIPATKLSESSSIGIGGGAKVGGGRGGGIPRLFTELVVTRVEFMEGVE